MNDPLRGLWRLADPKISLASAGSLLIGAAAAARAGPLDLPWLLATVLGVFCVEVAKNASGEIVDFDSGVDAAVLAEDRSPFSGGKRVMVDGLLSRAQTVLIAAVAYGLGIAAGLTIVLLREPRVLWLGVAGMASAYFYHAWPLRLSYRGLGETAVAFCYGPLIAAGTYLVQRHDLAPGALWVSLPYGVLVAAFLWVNELPDERADRGAGKNTLVVRLGRERGGRGYAFLAVAAAALVLVLPSTGLPRPVWLGGIALAPAYAAARRLWRCPQETAAILPAQRAALLAFVLYALGASLGLMLARG